MRERIAPTPIRLRITQNQTSIAVVERNSQSVHIFDKHTKEQVDEIQNLLRTEGTFRLWNVLVSEHSRHAERRRSLS